MERHYEGRAPRGLRRRGRLREKLLRGRRHSSNVFRHFRVDGAVRVGQRGGGGAHETPRRIPQTGKTNVGRNTPSQYYDTIAIKIVRYAE